MFKEKIKNLFSTTLVKTSLNVLFLKGAGVLLFFLTTLFITNNFDPKLVGQYDFSRSLLIFLGAVVVFGMNHSILYYSGYLAAKDNLGYLKKIYTKMVIMMSGFCALLFLLGWILQLSSVQDLFLIPVNSIAFKTITVLFFYGITTLNFEVFRAIDKIYLSELFRNIFRYSVFLMGVLLIYYQNNNELLVEVFLITFVVLAIFSTLLLLNYFSKQKVRADAEIFKYRDIFRRSAPMAVSATAFLLMQSLDILMLTNYTDYETVAYYGAAVKLTMLLSIVLMSVNTVIAPQIAALYEKEKITELKEHIRKSTRLIFILTAPLILIFAIFSSYVLSIFGDGYPSAKMSLWVLLLGQIFNAFCGSVGLYLNMTNKQRVFQIIVISALVVNVALNYLLIPVYGMVGAATATSVSMILWNIIAGIYIYKKDKVSTFLRF